MTKAKSRSDPFFSMPPTLKTYIRQHVNPDIIEVYGGMGFAGVMTELFFDAWQAAKIHNAKVIMRLVAQYHEMVKQYTSVYLRYMAVRRLRRYLDDRVRRLRAEGDRLRKTRQALQEETHSRTEALNQALEEWRNHVVQVTSLLFRGACISLYRAARRDIEAIERHVNDGADLEDLEQARLALRSRFMQLGTTAARALLIGGGHELLLRQRHLPVKTVKNRKRKCEVSHGTTSR